MNLFQISLELFIALGLFLSLAIVPSEGAENPVNLSDPNTIIRNISLDETETIPESNNGNLEFPLSDENLPKTCCNEKPPKIVQLMINDISYEDDTYPDVHIPCGEFDAPLDPICSCWGGKIIPEHVCQVCNVNLPPNGAAGVLIKCQNCTDLSNKNGNKSMRDYEILAAYISIPSYKNFTNVAVDLEID